jgi:small nuclear ribonucleoprotein (snRNP)-like protein
MNANRVVIGTLRGFDQFMNLVVDNTVEVNGDERTDIGMVVRFLPLFAQFVVALYALYAKTKTNCRLLGGTALS